MSGARAIGVDGFPELFRTLKNAGLVACLVGALLMISGRFMAGAPRLLTYVGVSIIVLGWGLFGYALFQRTAWRRARAAAGEIAGTQR